MTQTMERPPVGAPPPRRPTPRKRTRGALAPVQWVRKRMLALGIAALLLWLIAGPMAFLINMSFRQGTPARPKGFNLDNYIQVYGSSLTYSTLLNTVIYAGTVSLISLVLATVFAWLVERTDMPGRNLVWVAMLIPIAMPGMLSAMSWILLGSPKIGALNVWLRDLLGLVGIHMETGPFNIYSLYGMILVESLKGTSTLFLLIVGAFRLMDPALEDACTTSGAGRWHTLRYVTLPLMKPALLAAGIFAFLSNMEDFDTPLLLGLPANVFILPTLIYFTAYVSPTSSWGLASAYTSIFLILMLALIIYYYMVVVRRSKSFATVSGKGFRPHRVKLGRWKWPATGFVAVFFTLSIVLPLATLVFASMVPVYTGPSWDAIDTMTLDSYRQLIEDPPIVRAAINTVVMAIGAATATMVIAFLVSWVVIRVRVRGGILMDAMAFAPNAIPAVALGFGLIIFYLNPAGAWLPIYGTLVIIMVAIGTKYLAFTTRLGNSAMLQVSSELEEAAWVAGAGRLRGFFRVTMPLLFPTFIAGWVWVAAHAMRNLTFPLLLGTPGTETISLRMYVYWNRYADFPLTAAMGVCLILVLMILAFFSRRIIVRGFTENG
jgi:iron(III) transport system permease protein